MVSAVTIVSGVMAVCAEVPVLRVAVVAVILLAGYGVAGLGWPVPQGHTVAAGVHSLTCFSSV